MYKLQADETHGKGDALCNIIYIAYIYIYIYIYTYIRTATSSNLATCQYTQYTQYHIPVHIQVVLSTALKLGFRDHGEPYGGG